MANKDLVIISPGQVARYANVVSLIPHQDTYKNQPNDCIIKWNKKIDVSLSLLSL